MRVEKPLRVSGRTFWAVLGLLCLGMAGCSDLADFRRRMEDARQVEAVLNQYGRVLSESRPRDLIWLFGNEYASWDRRTFLPEMQDVEAQVEEIISLFDRVDRVWIRPVDLRHLSETDRVEVTARLALQGRMEDGRRLQMILRTPIALLRGGLPPTAPSLEGNPDGWAIVGHGPYRGATTYGTGPRFRDRTREAGLADIRVQTGPGRRQFTLLGTSVRTATPLVFRADPDERPDVLLPGLGGVRLLRNLPAESRAGLRLVDVTGPRGLEGVGAAWLANGDLDGDGREDLVAVGPTGSCRLFRNHGSRFEEKPFDALPGGTAGVAVADVNRDGRLDLFVLGTGRLGEETPEPLWAAENGGRNRLFLNEGGWQFREATESWGLEGERWSTACLFADLDGDGDPDLVVGNGFGPDRVWRNEGRRFVDVTETQAPDTSVACQGLSVADVDGDGSLDLYASGLFSPYAWIVRDPAVALPGGLFGSEGPRADLLGLLSGGRLYWNGVEEEAFQLERADEVTELEQIGWTRSAHFIDADNDGSFELWVPSGLFSAREGAGDGSFAYWRERLTRSKELPYPLGNRAIQGDEPDRLFRWAEDGEARDYGYIAGVAVPEDIRGAAAADLNRDGWIDLLRVDAAGRVRFLTRTPGENHVLRLRLEGRKTNRSARGARVWIRIGGQTLVREVWAGGGAVCGRDSGELLVGIGEAETVDAVAVGWPGGTIQRWGELEADRTVRLVEGEKEARVMEETK